MKNSQSFWNFFLLVWDIEWKIFHLLSTSFRRVCQNCILSVQKITLRETSFLNRKINIFCHFPTLGWKFSVFSRNSSRGWPKLHSTWTGAQFRLFLVIFGLWVVIFPTFWQKNFHQTVETAFYVYRRMFSVMIKILKNFERNTFFCYFETLSKNFPVFCPKLFVRFVKTAFFVSIRTFWGDFYFLGKVIFAERTKQNFFGLLSKSYQRVCQNCFLSVHSIFSNFELYINNQPIYNSNGLYVHNF